MREVRTFWLGRTLGHQGHDWVTDANTEVVICTPTEAEGVKVGVRLLQEWNPVAVQEGDVIDAPLRAIGISEQEPFDRRLAGDGSTKVIDINPVANTLVLLR